jgi:2-keto-4-pentenoate hydratase
VSVDTPLAAGMRLQLGRRDAELVAGAAPLGWKLGLTVPAVQQRLGLDGPVVGYLTTATELAPGTPHSLSGTTRPALEPEVAIHVGEDGSVGALGPAVEVIDVDLPFDDLQAILAGNVFHRAVLLGPPRAPDVMQVHARVTRKGQEAAAADAAVDPRAVLRHVSEFLADHGAEVGPGQRIIAGSLTDPIPVRPGDEVEVEVSPLGSLRLSFA